MSDDDDSKIEMLAARAPPPPVDAHGEAALLLVESLIHGLVARSTLSIREALDITRTAIDLQLEASDDRGDDPAVMPSPARLLTAIADSLEIDDRHGLP